MAKKPKIIPVGGGKGGVGKSFVSSSLAIAAAQSGQQTVVVDLDLGGANLHTLFGLKQTERGIGDFLYQPTSPNLLDYAVDTGVPNLKLISGNGFIPGIANIEYQRKLRVLKGVAHLDADLVILDLGAGTSYNVVDFFMMTQAGIIVTMHEPTAILNAYEFLKNVVYRLYAREFKDRPDVLAVINTFKASPESVGAGSVQALARAVGQADPGAEQALHRLHNELHAAFIVNMGRADVLNFSRSLEDICRAYLNLKVHYLGSIPDDPQVKDACVRMRPFLLEHASSKTAFLTRNLALKAIAGQWLDPARVDRLDGSAPSPAGAAPAAAAPVTAILDGHPDTDLSGLLAKFIHETATLTAPPPPEPSAATGTAVVSALDPVQETGLPWSFSPDTPALHFPIEPRMRPDAEMPYFIPFQETKPEPGLVKRVLSTFHTGDDQKPPSLHEPFQKIRANPSSPTVSAALRTLALQAAGNAAYCSEWLKTGMVLLEARQVSLAAKAFECAHLCNPQNETALNNRAASLMAAGQHEQARKLLLEGLKQSRAGAFLRFNLGLALLALRHYKEAAADFMRVRSLLAGHLYLPADFLEGFCRYRHRDFKAAESVFRTLAERDPADLYSRFNWALCQVRCGQHQEAAGTLSAVLQASPGDTEALILRALARSQCAQLDAALQDATAAIAAEPANLALYMARAILYRLKGRLDLAVSDLQRIMRLVPGHEAFRTLFARIQKEIAGGTPDPHENPVPAQSPGG
jgi:flagellar biosynthesis protein FlhG